MKTIAVWGSPGSGKSTVAVALAQEYAHKSKNTLIVNASRVCPMFLTFMPYNKYEQRKSFGYFLEGTINKERLLSCMQAPTKNEFLAYICTGDGDTYQRFPGDWLVTKLDSFQKLCENFIDVMILDLESNYLEDNFTLWGLEKADNVITVINPENKALSFINGYKTLLDNDEIYHTEKHTIVLNNCYSYSPYEKFMAEYDVKYVLPHSYEVYNNYIGGIEPIYKGDAKEASTFKKTIGDIIENELTEKKSKNKIKI